MLFKDGIDYLARRFSKNQSDPELRKTLGNHLNFAYREISESYPWTHLKRASELTLIPVHNSGTASITKDSNTVTGAGGTAWTGAMVGRLFRKKDANNWYRIVRVVNATQLILQSAIIEDTESGIDYQIWKRNYFLDSAVRIIWGFDDLSGVLSIQIESGGVAFNRNVPKFVQGKLATRAAFVDYGSDPFASIYNTGTISLTKDSDLMTGSGGTEWLANITSGDIIKIASQFLRVKTIEADDRIRLTSFSTTSLNSTTYEISKDAQFSLIFNFIPDKRRISNLTYITRVFDLVNEDFDRTILPQEFDLAILDRAEAAKKQDDNDTQWITILQRSEARLNSLKDKQDVLKRPYIQFAPVIPKTLGRQAEGR